MTPSRCKIDDEEKAYIYIYVYSTSPLYSWCDIASVQQDVIVILSPQPMSSGWVYEMVEVDIL